MSDDYPPEFLELLAAVTAKRPRIVIDHILKHGYVTTEELENLYGYKHAPRAARDVREQGIPLETFNVKNSDGRTIAAYRFGNISNITQSKLGGRKIFSKAFKTQLLEKQNHHCAICGTRYEERYLQIDHRVPYEVAGERERNIEEYMLVCGSCNRAKSWSCEHCQNWQTEKSSDICIACYWANPQTHQHIAMKPIRRIELIWTEAEVADFEKLAQQAGNTNLAEYIKQALKNLLG